MRRRCSSTFVFQASHSIMMMFGVSWHDDSMMPPVIPSDHGGPGRRGRPARPAPLPSAGLMLNGLENPACAQRRRLGPGISFVGGWASDTRIIVKNGNMIALFKLQQIIIKYKLSQNFRTVCVFRISQNADADFDRSSRCCFMHFGLS